MYSYANEVTSMTPGRGSYSMEFLHCDFVTQKIAERVIAAHKSHHAGDDEGEAASAEPVARSRTSPEAGLLAALGLRLARRDGLSLSLCGRLMASGILSGRSAALTRRRTAETGARAGV